MKRILSLAVLALLAACATYRTPPRSMFPLGEEPTPPRDLLERHYQVSRTVHPASGDTLTELLVQANFWSERVICSNLDAPPVRVTMLLRKHASATRSSPLTLLTVEYEASRPLGRDGDRTLQFRLDDDTLVPARYGNPTRATRQSASETIQYLVTPADLDEIVSAERSTARLTGGAGRCDFPITGQARGLMAMFAERELGLRRTAQR